MVRTTALDVCCMSTVTNQLGRDGLNPFWCRGKMCGACWIEWYEVCVCAGFLACVQAGRCWCCLGTSTWHQTRKVGVHMQQLMYVSWTPVEWFETDV